MGEGQPTFGELLRRYRHAAGLTQEALAERAGLSERGISDLERGVRSVPHPDTVRKLAVALALGSEERTALETAGGHRLGPSLLEPGRQSTPRSPVRTTHVGTRHNLPAATTSFIGREREVAEIRRLLSPEPPECRLLTLTGAGGCGKSRLALEVARTVTDAYPDGVWLVELAALADPWLVPQAVAVALGIREQPGLSRPNSGNSVHPVPGATPLVATLARVLRDRHLLLVLDNCEHLATACAELADVVLRAAPGLRILATSRVPLGLHGETTWRIPSLSLPAAKSDDAILLPGVPHSTLTQAQAAESEAVQLFCARAVLALPGFALTDANATAVSAICHHLDGIPLALELAAPWVRVIPVEELAARLATGLGLLTGSRVAPQRHRTLQATLEWSYDLLDPAEQHLLHRLAVFAGSFTLAAAETVGRDEKGVTTSVLPLLARLVDASLVTTEPSSGRYRLLETVRLDALERLAALGEVEATRRRHATYYRDQALTALPALWDSHPERDRWFAELDRDIDNIRAAWRWVDETGDVETSLWFGGALQAYFNVRGLLAEARERVTAALARSESRGEDGSRGPSGVGMGVGGPTRARAWALLAAAVLARSAEDYDEAVRHAGASADLFRQLDDVHGLTHALIILGAAYAWWEDVAAARPLLEEALTLCRTSGGGEWDGPGMGIPLFQLGVLALIEGDYSRAEVLLNEGLPALRARRDTYRVSHLLFVLGFVAIEQDRPEVADARLRESLAIASERHDLWALAFVLEGFACLCAREAPERALRLAGAADGLRARHEMYVSIRAFERLRDHLMAPAHAALDATTARAAWEVGRTLPFERVLAEVLTSEHARTV